MPDRRPIGDLDMLIEDQYAPAVTDIPHRRLTCLIGDPSETSTCFISDPSETGMPQLETHLKPTCHIGDPSDTEMPVRSLMKHVEVLDGSPIRNVVFQWFSDQACRSPMGLR